MARDTAALLRAHGVNPSAQRVAIAQYLLDTPQHPTAEEVLSRVRKRFPMVSRATVYNTLNLFVAKGLLRRYAVAGKNVVFDSNASNHHHFIDEATGVIYDVPWEAIRVPNLDSLDGFQVEEYQVVMRGRRRRPKKPERRP